MAAGAKDEVELPTPVEGTRGHELAPYEMFPVGANVGANAHERVAVQAELVGKGLRFSVPGYRLVLAP